MNLDQEIKKLQRLKAKINLYNLLQDNIQGELNRKDDEHKDLETEHQGLLEEFSNEVMQFCTQAISRIENPGKVVPRIEAVNQAPELTKEEVEAAKASKIVEDVYADIPTDPLRFALKYKAMEGKDVLVKTSNGEEVTAKIKGVNPPNLVVETDTGYTVQVHPTDIREA